MIEADPALCLDEVHDCMYNETSVYAELLDIVNDLKEHLKLTHKKVQKVHPNQCPVKQAQYIYTISNLETKWLVFAGKSLESLWNIKRLLLCLSVCNFQMKALLSKISCTMTMAESTD
ncbi:hypothetical protein CROQUDRAFT_315970 [Cronartium quercuum f. sp. fusiforme G11]|uniref:Uncharacterized protein n=1 Tax=Cronartium quercuum f. sp. fusiforme G11 TaxID=708437 RepID=A0A9P6NUK2_9BASI|nr:hypothetical protein CROQUDRAFT_315970 [Cronartium quercuum f. sp. fusiforme G11]